MRTLTGMLAGLGQWRWSRREAGPVQRGMPYGGALRSRPNQGLELKTLCLGKMEGWASTQAKQINKLSDRARTDDAVRHTRTGALGANRRGMGLKQARQEEGRGTWFTQTLDLGGGGAVGSGGNAHTHHTSYWSRNPERPPQVQHTCTHYSSSGVLKSSRFTSKGLLIKEPKHKEP